MADHVPTPSAALITLREQLEWAESFVVESDRAVHVQRALISALQASGVDPVLDRSVLDVLLTTRDGNVAERDRLVREIAGLLAGTP